MASTVAEAEAEAAAAAEESSKQPLKYKTWVLKVPIHCQGCKAKVKKVLQGIDGVFITNIEQKLHKVTVTGNVDVETLVKKLTKNGKPAEMWPEKPSGKEKKPGKAKNKGKEDDPKGEDNGSPPAEVVQEPASAQKQTGEASHELGKELKPGGGKPTENAPASENPAAPGHNGGESGLATGKSGGGKKKKKKGQKGNNGGGSGTGSQPSCVPAGTGSPAQNPGTDQVMGTVNLGPTRADPYPYPYPYPQTFPFHPVYIANYSRAKYYPELYQMRAMALDTLEIFSDENPNGCSIV